MGTERAREILELTSNFWRMSNSVDQLDGGRLRAKAVNDLHSQAGKINAAGGPEAVALAMQVLMNEIPDA